MWDNSIVNGCLSWELSSLIVSPNIKSDMSAAYFVLVLSSADNLAKQIEQHSHELTDLLISLVQTLLHDFTFSVSIW